MLITPSSPLLLRLKPLRIRERPHSVADQCLAPGLLRQPFQAELHRVGGAQAMRQLRPILGCISGPGRHIHQPQEGIEIVAVCQAAEHSPKRSLGQYSALVEISPLAIRVRSAW